MNTSLLIRPVKLIHALALVCARVKSVKMMMELLNVLNQQLVAKKTDCKLAVMASPVHLFPKQRGAVHLQNAGPGNRKILVVPSNVN